MKILEQFIISNHDLKKLYIINRHCNQIIDWNGCGDCPGNLHSTSYDLCGLRRVTLRSEPKCAIPGEWNIAKKFSGLEIEFSDEELKGAVKWWRELLQTDEYKKYDKYVNIQYKKGL